MTGISGDSKIITQRPKGTFKTILFLRFNYNKKFLLKLFLLGFIFFFMLDAYDNLRYAKVVETLYIEILGLSERDLMKIDLFRLGPISGITKVLPEKNRELKTIWVINNNYLKKVFLKIPIKIIEKIEKIDFKLGNKMYSYFHYNLFELRLTTNDEYFDLLDNNFIILEMPEKVRTNKLNIYFFSNIINWKGFLNIFFYSFINSFFIFPIVFLLLYNDLYNNLFKIK